MARIIFAGTPDFAVPSLQALIDAGHDICAVYTQPDRPAKRGQQLQASAIKQCALRHGLTVYQPSTLRNPEVQAQIVEFQSDAMIVVAYGLLLPEAVLTAPKHGCINVHGSLLPKWRGAAPIQRAIEAGDPETGITIMAMDKGLDTGGLYHQQALPIASDDTSASLFVTLAHLGAQALLQSLPKILCGELVAIAQQDHLSSHAAKLTKQEAELNWQAAATTLVRQIQAFNPWPGATLTLSDIAFKIWQAEVVDNPNPQATPGTWLSLNEHGLLIACREQALQIRHIQLPNQKRQSVCDIYRQGPLADYFKRHSS